MRGRINALTPERKPASEQPTTTLEDHPREKVTTSAGNPIAETSMRSAPAPWYGELQDYSDEKLAHQNRERIPERPVHAKGGARTEDDNQRRYSKYTRPRCEPRRTRTPML